MVNWGKFGAVGKIFKGDTGASIASGVAGGLLDSTSTLLTRMTGDSWPQYLAWSTGINAATIIGSHYLSKKPEYRYIGKTLSTGASHNMTRQFIDAMAAEWGRRPVRSVYGLKESVNRFVKNVRGEFGKFGRLGPSTTVKKIQQAISGPSSRQILGEPTISSHSGTYKLVAKSRSPIR